MAPCGALRRRSLLGWAWASGLAPAGVARADRPQWRWQVFPFGQQLDMDAVYDAAHSPPDQLLATIRRHGVDVRRVVSSPSSRPLNPLLAGVPAADAELLRLADFQEGYEGRVLCAALSCGRLTRDTLLVRDNASTYTLIHEFVQALLVPVQPAAVDVELESRFAAAFRRLTLYQRRLYDDPYRLLSPLWRRDILAAQSDVVADLYDRIRIGQSQEAIVEKVLGRYIDERSPYFDAARQAEGRLYGQNMINNAIDLHNTVHDSLVFVAETVANLRQALRDRQIEPGPDVQLSDDESAAVRRTTQDLLQRLAVVKDEIGALKDFYAR